MGSFPLKTRSSEAKVTQPELQDGAAVSVGTWKVLLTYLPCAYTSAGGQNIKQQREKKMYFPLLDPQSTRTDAITNIHKCIGAGPSLRFFGISPSIGYQEPSRGFDVITKVIGCDIQRLF